MEIPVSQIWISKSSVIDWRFVEKLALSIKFAGLIQIPSVHKKAGKYKCITGRHTFLACRSIGMASVYCNVIPETASDEKLRLISIESNRVRKPISQTDIENMDLISDQIIMSNLSRSYVPEHKKATAQIRAFIRSERQKGLYIDSVIKRDKKALSMSNVNKIDSLPDEARANLNMTQFSKDKASEEFLRQFSQAEAILISRIMMMNEGMNVERAVDAMKYAKRYGRVNWPDDLDYAVSKIKPDVYKLIGLIRRVRKEVLKYRAHIEKKRTGTQIARGLAFVDLMLSNLCSKIQKTMVPFAVCSECNGNGSQGNCRRCYGDGWIAEENYSSKDPKIRE